MEYSNTTNKSDRELGNKFDLTQFNKKFVANDEITQQNNLMTYNMKKPDEIIDSKLPHKKPIEDLIINIRELFYKIIEMLIDRQNPIPWILSTPDRHFAASILLIMIGTLLLLFSNLMISSSN